MQSFQLLGQVSSHPAYLGSSEVIYCSFSLTTRIYCHIVYTRVLLSLLTVYGTLVIGLFISWTTTSIQLYDEMDKTLLIVVVSFQAIFAVLCTFVWSGNNRLLAYVDLVVSTANPLLDWYFVSQYVLNGGLSPGQISSEVLLLGYQVSRVWSKAIFVETASQTQSTVLDSFHLVWCTSSAKLAARMLPDLTKHWDRLVAKWGDDAPKGMCDCE